MTNQVSHSNENNELEPNGAAESFITKNAKLIGIALAVVVIAGAGYFLYDSLVAKPRNLEAQERIAASENFFKDKEYEKALNGDSINGGGFLQIIEEYGNTPTGNLAKLQAGLCYAQLGEYAKAIPFLEEYDGCDDAIITPAAMMALGNCYAQTEKEDKAAETLEKAAKKADNISLSPICLMQAADVYIKLGKSDKALECYKTIKSKYPTSSLAANIDKYIDSIGK